MRRITGRLRTIICSRSCRPVVLAALLGLGSSGCGVIPHEPIEDVTPVGEMGKAPGLFSGEDGEFVIYRR
jgi:hypothetical protein